MTRDGVTGFESRNPVRTGPAVLTDVGWVSPYQATRTAFDDEETISVRMICHRVVDFLPKDANSELLRVMVDMFRFYRPAAVAIEERPTPRKKLTVTRVSKSVRPEIALGEEDG